MPATTTTGHSNVSFAGADAAGIAHSILNIPCGFQSSLGAYVATCRCGWSVQTIMGRGDLGKHRAAVAAHSCPWTCEGCND